MDTPPADEIPFDTGRLIAAANRPGRSEPADMDKAVAADESLGTDERDTCCASEDTGDKKLLEDDEANGPWALYKLEDNDISGIISPSLNLTIGIKFVPGALVPVRWACLVGCWSAKLRSLHGPFTFSLTFIRKLIALNGSLKVYDEKSGTFH